MSVPYLTVSVNTRASDGSMKRVDIGNKGKITETVLDRKDGLGGKIGLACTVLLPRISHTQTDNNGLQQENPVALSPNTAPEIK